MFRGEIGERGLDVNAVRGSRTNFLIAVTNAKSGEGTFISGQDRSIDLISALKASTAMPVAYNRFVNLNGVDYFDGAGDHPLPIDYMVEELRCTDVLIIINKPSKASGDLREEIIERLALRFLAQNYSSKAKEAFTSRYPRLRSTMERILLLDVYRDRANIAIARPQGPKMSRFSRDRIKLEALALEGEQTALRLFSQ